jgi:hypothetical protein
MMLIASTTTALDDDDENIPLVQAVYIDGELTEIHADDVIVDTMAFSMGGETPVAVVADEVSPRRSSCCSCISNNSTSTSASNHGRRNSVPVEEDATSATSRTSFTFTSVDHQQGQDFADSLEDIDDSQIFGAGAAGAVLGLLMGGPLLCVVFGLGSLYCSQQEGAAGDVARAMGDVALLTHSKFQEVNQKHHLVDEGKQAAGKAFTKLKEAKERRRQRRWHRHACDKKVKFRKFVAWCWKSLVEFERKHQFLGRMSQKAKEQLDALVEQYLPSDGSVNPSNQDQSSSNSIQQ